MYLTIRLIIVTKTRPPRKEVLKRGIVITLCFWLVGPPQPIIAPTIRRRLNRRIHPLGCKIQHCLLVPIGRKRNKPFTVRVARANELYNVLLKIQRNGHIRLFFVVGIERVREILGVDGGRNTEDIAMDAPVFVGTLQSVRVAVDD